MNKRYIKSITLENFQSYKNQTINLKPGLNLVLGTSDAGKSTILRAISFVLHNYPKRDTFIHWGEKEMRVTLEFSDGAKVTRIKGEGVNAIEAVDSKGNIYQKNKIDTEIPDDIREILGNPPQDDLNGLISYADQFSKMFLVDLSPTDLPRALSNLTKIEVLEDSAKQLMSNYKSIDKQIKVDEKEYDKLLNESQSYSYVNDYEKKLARLSQAIIEVQNLENSISDMQKIIASMDLNVDPICVEAYKRLLVKVDDCIEGVRSALSVAEKLEKLEVFGLLANHHIASDDIEKLDSLVGRIETAQKNTTSATKIAESINSLKTLNDGYLTIKDKGQKISAEYKNLQEQLKKEQEDYDSFKKMLVEKKIQCEACGSILA